MDHTVSLHFQELCFDHLLSLSSNQHCADCRLQNPDWISLSYGAIICQRCSGVHRSLGVKNTRVRSVKLDTWTLRNLYFMFFITNDKVNDYFEANLPEGFMKPDYETSAEDLADFIREKYVNRSYVDETKESPVDKANEKVNQIEEPIENTDQEEFFKIKQEELGKLIKARLKRLRPAIMFAVSSPQKDTAKLISKSSRKAPEMKFSHFTKRSLKTPSPPRLKNFSPRENNFLDVSHNKSPVNAQTSFLSLFDGLIVKSSTKSNHNLNSSFLTDDRRDSRRLSNFSLNELNPGEPIELTELKTPPQKKKSQFFKANNPPSIDLEMEDWSAKDHHHQQAQRLNTIEGVDGIDFGGTLEALPTPKLMTMDSLEQDLIVPLNEPQMAQHKSITLTLKEAEKSNTSTHLKRPSEAFDTPRMILDETKLGHPGLSEKWRKTFAIIGCLIIHFLMGYIFCWGAISPEISAYFEAEYGLEFSYESRINIAGLSTLLFFGMTVGYAFSEKSVNIFGMRAVSFVSFLALSAVLSLSGLKINMLLDVFLMTLLPGFCIGVIYPIPFYCAVQYFPRNINVIRVFFFIANGLGACIIANLYPILLSEEANGTKISTFFEILAAGILILSLLGNVLIYPKVNFVEKEWLRWSDKEKSLLSNLHLNNTPAMSRVPSEIINATEAQIPIALQLQRPIKALLGVISCYFVLPGFLCFAYRVEAERIDPNTNSLNGGIGMLLMAVGRALGTFLYHKMGFKKSMRLAIIVQAILALAMFVWGEKTNGFVPVFFGFTVIAGIGLSILAGEASLVIKGKQELLLTGVVVLGFAIANMISLMIFGMIQVLDIERFLYLGLAVPMLVAFYLVMRLPEGQEYEKKHTIEMTRMSTFRM